VNHKVIYRLYKDEGLVLRRRKPKRRVMAARREARSIPENTNQSWSMDFMSDQLYSGRPIRFLMIVDNYSRESLAIKAGISLKGDDVVEILNGLIRERGAPKNIKVDNGTEFTSIVLD
jgi:putative transposase